MDVSTGLAATNGTFVIVSLILNKIYVLRLRSLDTISRKIIVHLKPHVVETFVIQGWDVGTKVWSSNVTLLEY